jgi:hypothetical protein
MPEADKPLKIRTDGPATWLLADALTGQDVGGIFYCHDKDGNHYQPWLLVDGVRTGLAEKHAQLGSAARAVALRATH